MGEFSNLSFDFLGLKGLYKGLFPMLQGSPPALKSNSPHNVLPKDTSDLKTMCPFQISIMVQKWNSCEPCKTVLRCAVVQHESSTTKFTIMCLKNKCSKINLQILSFILTCYKSEGVEYKNYIYLSFSKCNFCA